MLPPPPPPALTRQLWRNLRNMTRQDWQVVAFWSAVTAVCLYPAALEAQRLGHPDKSSSNTKERTTTRAFGEQDAMSARRRGRRRQEASANNAVDFARGGLGEDYVYFPQRWHRYSTRREN